MEIPDQLDKVPGLFSKKHLFVLGVILLSALSLRLAGIEWGLPGREHTWPYHPDESNVLLALAQTHPLKGDISLHPWDISWGGAYYYGIGAVYMIGHAFGFLSIVPHIEFYREHPEMLGKMVLVGRLVSVGAGMITVLLCGWCAWRIMGVGFGLLAMAFLAFSPLHIQHSHFQTVHITAAALTWAALALTLRWQGALTRYRLMALGLVAGLAAGTEFVQALTAVAIGASLACDKKNRSLPLMFLAVSAASIFLLTNPSIGMDFSGWLDAAKGPHQKFTAWSFSIIDPARRLAIAAGGPMLILGLGGLVAAARRPLLRPFIFHALLYFFLIAFSGNLFARRWITLLPAMALFGAFLCSLLPRSLAVCLASVALIAELCLSAAIVGLFSTGDTRTRAAEWCAQNLPQSSEVGLENWFFAPHIKADRYQIKVGSLLPTDTPAWWIGTEFNGPSPLILEKRYDPVASFQSPPHVGPIIFDDQHWPEDMRYANPTITVWRWRGLPATQPI